MPLSTKDSKDMQALQLKAPEEAESTSPDFSTTMAAAFRMENPIYNGMNRLIRDQGLENKQLDITFDPFQEPSLQNLGLNEDELDEFITSKNREDYLQRLDSVLKRRRDVRTMSESGIGASTVAYLFAGITDPINLLPMGVFAKNVKTGSKIATTALQTTATGGLSIGASEAALKLTQRGRTDEEFVQNTLAGATFAAFLGVGGGLAGAAFSKQAAKIKTATEVDPIKDIEKFADHNEVFDDSIGAARTPTATLDDLTFDPGTGISSFAFTAVEKSTRFVSPALSLMNNPNVAVRSISENLMEIPLVTKGANAFASPQSVETFIQEVRKPLSDSFTSHGKLYKEYRAASKAGGEQVLSREQFNEEISFAMRREDFSRNKFVRQTARAYRKNLFKPLSDEAIAVKLLPEDVRVDTAPSYLTRIWDTPKIIAKEPELRGIIKDHYKGDMNKTISTLEARVVKGEALESKAKPTKTDKADIEAGKEARSDLATVFAKESQDDYLEDIATNVLNSLKGFDHLSSIPDIKIIARGPLKERTLNIPDDKIEDFLVNDITLIAQRFARTLKPEIELKRKFGTVNFDDVKGEILEKHEELIKGITDPKKLEELNSSVRKGISDLDHIWDLVRGTYHIRGGNPDSLWRRASAFGRDFNYLRSMGQIVTASIPDTGSLLRMGMGRAFKDGINPFVKNVVSGNQALNTKIAQQYGKATEAVLANRVSSMFNIGDPISTNQTMIEKMASHMANKFGNITPINYWNNMMQEISTMATQQRIIDNLVSSTATENKFMNFLGLSDDMRKRIKGQIDEFGEIENDTTLTNVDKWNDVAARRAMTAAINKEVDRIIVVKKVGDAPIVSNTPVGKVLTQFLNFLMASNQRVLLAGLQQGDASIMTSYMTMVGLGMMVYGFRTPNDKISEDPSVWLREGLDRSGITAVPFYFGNLGYSALTQSPERALTSALGPTASLATGLMKVAQGVSDGSINENDVKNIRRILPYQNLIWLILTEKLADKKAEGLISKGLGLPKGKTKKRKLRRTQ